MTPFVPGKQWSGIKEPVRWGKMTLRSKYVTMKGGELVCQCGRRLVELDVLPPACGGRISIACPRCKFQVGTFTLPSVVHEHEPMAVQPSEG